MLFIMKQGISPMWEDPKNRDGGCFSYKVPNKSVVKAWSELTYRIVGASISNTNPFVNSVTGITISPKKNVSWSDNSNFELVDEDEQNIFNKLVRFDWRKSCNLFG